MTWISEFFRIIIWKFSIFIKPINPEKFSVNSIIWLRNLQRRRQEFFERERPGHLNAIKRPLRGSGGGKGPPDGSEVSFFKTIQSTWKWIHFSKMSTFFFSKRSIFSKKNLEKLNIFYKNFWIFSKNYFKFSIFMRTYKTREILCEFEYLIEKLMKKLKK